jgi:UDP-glucose 4-epimerase
VNVKVLVTGATGNVGPALVERLVACGDTVKVIGRKPGHVIPGAVYRSCDITDFPRLVEETRGMDAVAHLAAIPGPHMGGPEAIFLANCQGSMNVYQAASLAGIRRVVSASSINAIGYGMGVKEWPIRYLPMDEAHPTFATDAYSYSKNVLESIAEFYWRRDGISGACIRIPAVLPVQYSTEDIRQGAEADQHRLPRAVRERQSQPHGAPLAGARGDLLPRGADRGHG